MRRRPVGLALALLTAGVLALTGCSNIGTEIATLKPVAGDKLTGLNIAVNDVLLAKGVNVLVAPVCTFDADAYSCAGTTVDDKRIEATAEGAEPETMTITVGGKKLFEGNISDVLTKAGQR